MNKPGRLFLLPAPLRPQSSEGWSAQEIAAELPAAALDRMRLISRFVVESERTASRMLSRVLAPDAMQALAFHVLDEHSGPEALVAPLEDLRAGMDLGLLSEAGIPCVADPGAALVAAAHAIGIEVLPISGPSSIILAISASGLEAQRFMFLGYLPSEPAARGAALAAQARAFRADGMTRVFIETPYRNAALLSACLDALPPELHLCIAAGLASPEESVRCMKVGEWKSGGQPAPGKLPAIFLFGKPAALRPAGASATRAPGPNRAGTKRPGSKRTGLKRPGLTRPGKPAARG